MVQDTTTENTRMIEEMMRDAEKAGEPGDLAQNPVIHAGDDTVPPMVAIKMESAGYVYIYNQKTGDRSKCNNNMLPRKLQLKDNDGRFVFTTIKPKVTPQVGTLPCMLHEKAPNRQHYDDMGFPVCPKDNLLSSFHVRRHMQKRHKVEWSAIEEERIEREKQEDREFQRQLVMGKAEKKPPLYVSDKDKKK